MVHHHPRTPDFNVVSVKRCFVVRGLIWFVHSSQPPSPTGQHWTMGGKGVNSARVWIIRPPTVLAFDVSFVSPNTSKPSTVSIVWFCTHPHARNIGLTYRLHLVLKHHCPLHLLLAVEECVSPWYGTLVSFASVPVSLHTLSKVH